MKFKDLLATLILCIIILIFILCQQNNNVKKKDILYITCTTTMIADMAKKLTAQTNANITCLMGPGIDPHLYKVVERDTNALIQADIIFFNGLHLEARMSTLLEQINHTTSCAISKDLHPSELISDSEHPHEFDPHIWFDITLWKKAAQCMYKALSAYCPQQKKLYEKNLTQFIKELDQTHETIIELCKKIPENKKILITGHDAFSYFARSYGFTIMSLQGISTQTSPSLYELQQIVDTIISYQIPTIFIENSFPIKHIRALQEGAASYGYTVSSGNVLFADSLSEQGGPAASYSAMLLYNAHTIAAGLTKK